MVISFVSRVRLAVPAAEECGRSTARDDDRKPVFHFMDNFAGARQSLTAIGLTQQTRCAPQAIQPLCTEELK